MKPLRYVAREWPDPASPQFRLTAGGDVAEAIWADGEHLLRTLAAFPPGSASLAMRFDYDPARGNGNLQQRLRLQLLGQAHQDDVAVGLRILLDRSPIRRFYDLQPADEDDIPCRKLGVACDIVRRQAVLDPTVSPELNAKVPPAYWMLWSFQPRQDNDYLLLDSVLASVEERVLVEICLEPCDISAELSWHTRYLWVLQQVNRSWDGDDEETSSPRWRGGRGDWDSALKPLRQRDPLADEVHRHQQRFHETLTMPHLCFHIRAFAQTPAIARLVASIVAEAAFEEGSYQLFDLPVAGKAVLGAAMRTRANLRAMPSGVLGHTLKDKDVALLAGATKLANVAPAEELVSVFRLPVASPGPLHCTRKNTDPPYRDPADLLILGHDEQHAARAGHTDAPGLPRGIWIEKDLAKHMGIFGGSGMGKTTSAAFNILLQVAARGIPFIVLEPAKTEYRMLKTLTGHSDPDIRQLARELQVYTPGNESISPMRLNPLQIIEGISCYEHIENVCRCFQAAMPMGGPMPALLGESLERVYERYPTPNRPPRMADLYATVKEVAAEKGYSGDVASDVRAAIEVRLGALTRRAIGQVLQSPHNAPSMNRLMTGYSIIELIRTPGEKGCLLTLFVLTAIREYVRAVPWTGKGLRLVVVLEEAHNLVGRDANATPSEENADPKAYASRFVCEMLAEMRAMGVALIIVDQLPSAVAPEVIKNTGAKLAFREVDREDREILGASMLFGPVEMEEIARLQPGEAYFFTEGYFGPRRIRTPNLQAQIPLPKEPNDRAILELVRDDPWFLEAADSRIGAEMVELARQMNEFGAFQKHTADRMATLIAQRVQILASVSTQQRAAKLRQIRDGAVALHGQLNRRFRAFCRDAYRPLMGDDPQTPVRMEELQAFRNQLRGRYKSVIEPGVRSCLERLDQLSTDCRNHPIRGKKESQR